MGNNYEKYELNSGSNIDLSKLVRGIKKFDTNNKNTASIFEKFDLDNNGILDQSELSTFLGSIIQFSGNDNNISTDEMQKDCLELGLNSTDAKVISSFMKDIKKIASIKEIKLEDGSSGLVVQYKSDENGNTTTIVYDKNTGNIRQHRVLTAQNIETTTYYDKTGNNVVNSIVKVLNENITQEIDNLGRLKIQEEKNKTTKYEYKDETVSPKKIDVKYADGKFVIFQDGKKISIQINGERTETEDSRTQSTDSDSIKSKPVRPDISRIVQNIRPNQNHRAKQIASNLQNLIYNNNHDTNIPVKIQNYIKQNVNVNNIDWVLYEYKVLTKKDLFSDLETKLKNYKEINTSIKRRLADVQYKKYNVNLNFKKQNSKIQNEYHTGDSYSIVQNGTIITIKNERTKQQRQIDLDKLLRNYPNARDRAKIIKQLQNLPGEVLMDIAIETDSFIPLKNTTETITVAGGAQCNAAGYYAGSDDTIHINHSNGNLTLVHEVGHAVDYNGIRQNRSSVLNDPNFKKIFNEEMRQYISAGNQRYVYNSPNSKRNTYATANEQEMFAECYTLLMMGKCNSQNIIEKYFPKTLKYIDNKIKQIRNMKDNVRH